LSFNQPKFCPTPVWNPNGITFANRTTVDEDPVNIFVDTNNTVYITSGQSNKIFVWFNDSIHPTKIISGDFSTPESIFVTNNADIFIANGVSEYRVDKWISNTNTTVTVMNTIEYCLSIFVDINDTLYCSMKEYHQVVKRWLNENLTTTTVVAAGTGFWGSGSNELQHPFGIFVDVNFDLYVADCGNDRIQLFQSGQLNGTTVVGVSSSNPTISLSRPSGIVLDADKYLFIVDSDNHRIIRSGPNGFQCVVGCSERGSQSNQLLMPKTLSFDSYGNMFVSDVENKRILKYLFLEKCCGKLKVV
ncbi:unnamed protein product, partial [Rotaria sordida]